MNLPQKYEKFLRVLTMDIDNVVKVLEMHHNFKQSNLMGSGERPQSGSIQ